jgi:hypothetical protein
MGSLAAQRIWKPVRRTVIRGSAVPRPWPSDPLAATDAGTGATAPLDVILQPLLEWKP